MSSERYGALLGLSRGPALGGCVAGRRRIAALVAPRRQQQLAASGPTPRAQAGAACCTQAQRWRGWAPPAPPPRPAYSCISPSGRPAAWAWAAWQPQPLRWLPTWRGRRGGAGRACSSTTSSQVCGWDGGAGAGAGGSGPAGACCMGLLLARRGSPSSRRCSCSLRSRRVLRGAAELVGALLAPAHLLVRPGMPGLPGHLVTGHRVAPVAAAARQKGAAALSPLRRSHLQLKCGMLASFPPKCRWVCLGLKPCGLPPHPRPGPGAGRGDRGAGSSGVCKRHAAARAPAG